MMKMNKGAPVTKSTTSIKPLLAAVCAASVALSAQAQVPGAGTILQQVQPVKPAKPASAATGLRLEQPDGAQLPPGAPFLVKRIVIAGNSRFDTATLHALVADAEGKEHRLQALNELAARITAHYRSHGYPLARAYIPAQVIRDGVVNIEVIEARYGQVSLLNRSRVNDVLLRDSIATLQAGQPIDQEPLDHALLLASDIPGVTISATLKPGQAVGTSDLVVDAHSGAPLSASVVLDNDGNRYTGRARAAANASYSNALGRGDVFSVTALTSGEGLYYGRLGYETLLNGRGTSVGASASALRYVLGGPLASADAHGTARVNSVWGKQTLLRGRERNLSGQLQYDRLNLRDHVAIVHNDRHLDYWNASLAGDLRDGGLAGAVSTMTLAVTTGQLAFDNPGARAADAASAHSARRFSKWNAGLTRLQSLGGATSVYMSLSAQWAGSNLDASQKMSVGGPYSVRAYDAGVLAGDTGVGASVELRRDLGPWQAMAFIDSAHINVNKRPWPGVTGVNGATLQGIGVGLSWTDGRHWQARASVAKPTGSTPVQLTDSRSVRGWLSVSRVF
jgi:hemolysin activation/secretion protein